MKVVDLFCGTGGFSLGAHLAGLEVVRAIDIDPVLTSTFKSNFPNTNLTLGDISELSGSDLKRTVAEPIDALIGGPPCQPKFTMHFLQVIYVQGHTSPINTSSGTTMDYGRTFSTADQTTVFFVERGL